MQAILVLDLAREIMRVANKATRRTLALLNHDYMKQFMYLREVIHGFCAATSEDYDYKLIADKILVLREVKQHPVKTWAEYTELTGETPAEYLTQYVEAKLRWIPKDIKVSFARRDIKYDIMVARSGYFTAGIAVNYSRNISGEIACYYYGHRYSARLQIARLCGGTGQIYIHPKEIKYMRRSQRITRWVLKHISPKYIFSSVVVYGNLDYLKKFIDQYIDLQQDDVAPSELNRYRPAGLVHVFVTSSAEYIKYIYQTIPEICGEFVRLVCSNDSSMLHKESLSTDRMKYLARSCPEIFDTLTYGERLHFMSDQYGIHYYLELHPREVVARMFMDIIFALPVVTMVFICDEMMKICSEYPAERLTVDQIITLSKYYIYVGLKSFDITNPTAISNALCSLAHMKHVGICNHKDWIELLKTALIDKSISISPKDKTHVVKIAYIMDDLQLLLNIIKDKLKYPHSVNKQYLTKNGNIDRWRTENNL